MLVFLLYLLYKNTFICEVPKVKITINKTNTAKLNKFFRMAEERWPDFYSEEFVNYFTEHLRNEIKSIKDCSEKSIVDEYVDFGRRILDKTTNGDYKAMFPELQSAVRAKLAKKYTGKELFDNNIDIYFNEVKREYINHPMNDSDNLEFTPENRDVFIKNNLKLVIECAKRYRNLGLSFEDLIQVGNVGLLTAFEHYDTNRNKLQTEIINQINIHENEEFTYDESVELVKKAFSYDKNLDKTLKTIPATGFSTKTSFIEWAKKNVKNAVFASIAFQWIRAYIVLELSKYSSIVRIPKMSGEEEDETSAVSAKILRLDSINPHTNDCYHDNDIAEVANEEFLIENSYVENMERQQTFSQVINNALYKLDATSARIVKKRFGIDFPYQLTINEIAENERISVSKVKSVLSAALTEIARIIPDRDKEIIRDMLE